MPRKSLTVLHRLRVALLEQSQVPRDMLAHRSASSLKIVEEALAAGADQPWVPAQVLTTAITTLGKTGHEEIIPEVLRRSRSTMQGRHRAYNAAARAIALDRSNSGRVPRIMAILDQMRTDGLRPSAFTLRHLFIAARGEVSNPRCLLQHMVDQMKEGVRPDRAAYDAMLAACVGANQPTAGQACNAPSLQARAPAPPPSTRGNAMALLIAVGQQCRVQPSCETVKLLLMNAQYAADVDAIERLIAALPRPIRRALNADGAVLAARARVSTREMADAALRKLHSLQADRVPPPRARRALLISCVSHGEYSRCLWLLQALWREGVPIDEKTARRLIHCAGEGTRRSEPDAGALLEALTGAMFGCDGSAEVQRAVYRRSSVAQLDAVRTIARAEWRAGVCSALAAQEQALARLKAAQVAASPRLVATFVYMHAAQGHFGAALSLLGVKLPGGAPSTLRSERPYHALLGAIHRPVDVDHAIEALRLMLSAGLCPSLGTRLALITMAERLQQAQLRQRRMDSLAPVPALPIPGAARFWAPQSLPVQRWLAALQQETADEPEGWMATDGPLVGAAADLILETRMAAHLQRIAQIMNEGTPLVVRELASCAPTSPHESAGLDASRDAHAVD